MSFLNENIYSQLKTDFALVSLATGGIFLGRAPSSAQIPYLIVDMENDSEPEYETDESFLQERTVRFHAWTQNPKTAKQILKAVKDNVKTSLPDPAILQKVESETVDTDPDKDEQGADVWQGVLDLVFTCGDS